MSDDDKLRSDLDTAVRSYAEDIVDDGEVITNWVTLAATRRFDGRGVVMVLPGDDALPMYVLRGMLHEVLATIDRRQDRVESGD